MRSFSPCYRLFLDLYHSIFIVFTIHILLISDGGVYFLQVLQAGFSAPTPIQAQSWPIALKGRDIVAVAKTGSGKTLGYLIPGFILLKRLQHNSREGPTVLVLSPTRELATQIQDEAIKFGRSSRISSTVCCFVFFLSPLSSLCFINRTCVIFSNDLLC